MLDLETSVAPRVTAVRDDRYIQSLDGVRAVAFLLVFFSHVDGLSWVPGGFGVTLFFFLSGFLLTTLMRGEADRTGKVSIKHFYLRRALRIFPPMYLTIAFGLVLAWLNLLPTTPTPRGIAAEMLHLTNYFLIAGNLAEVVPGQNVYWSLAVEEHFYVIFPWLMGWALIHHSRRWTTGMLIGGCIAILIWRMALLFELDAQPLRLQYGTDTRLDSILYGALLAVAANPVLDPPRICGTRRHLLLFCVASLGLLATMVSGNVGFRETLRYSLQGLLLLPFYYAVMSGASAPFVAFLSHPWLRYLGVISYSLYLVHHTWLLVLQKALPGAPLAVTAALALTLSIVYASGMWYVVERPLMTFRRRLRV